MNVDGLATRPPLVYLVDDEPGVAFTLSEVLRHSGCQVKTFLNGSDLIASPPDDPPDIVITDFAMQPVDGLRVAAWVRSAYPGARILMITADAQLVRRGEVKYLPFRVMEKPLTSASLIAAVYDTGVE
jgi:DNA-binding NtrC family response regulator